MHLRLTLLLLAGLAGLPPTTARATVVEPRTVEDQTRDADAVVVGRVEARRTVAVDGGRRLLTVLTVRVDESLKGTPGETAEVVVPGGEQGDLVQRVVGLPVLETGDPVALFLGRRPGRKLRYGLPGLGQSVYRVRDDAVVRQVQGLEVVTGPLDGDGPPFPDVRIRLEELRQRVRSAAQAPSTLGADRSPTPAREVR